jgi:hypothetical protein
MSQHIVLGPQGEPILCKSAAEARSLEARKRKAEPTVTFKEEAVCPTCGRAIDDDTEEDGQRAKSE